VTLEVRFHPLAEADLEAIYDHIAADSHDNAIAYVRRLRQQCLRLSFFPSRGHARRDLPPGVRAVVFERRTLIAYRREGERVVVLRLPCGGRDIEGAF